MAKPAATKNKPTGVTATFGAPLAPTLTTVPDALVGRCWPAVW